MNCFAEQRGERQHLAKPLLDEERPKRQSHRLRRTPVVGLN